MTLEVLMGLSGYWRTQPKTIIILQPCGLPERAEATQNVVCIF